MSLPVLCRLLPAESVIGEVDETANVPLASGIVISLLDDGLDAKSNRMTTSDRSKN